MYHSPFHANRNVYFNFLVDIPLWARAYFCLCGSSATWTEIRKRVIKRVALPSQRRQPRNCWLSTIIKQQTSFESFLEVSRAAEMSYGNWTFTSYSYSKLLLPFRRSLCDFMALKILASKQDFASTWQREWVNSCMTIALYLHEFKMAANAVENDCPPPIVRLFSPINANIGLSIFFSVHFTFVLVLIERVFLSLTIKSFFSERSFPKFSLP